MNNRLSNTRKVKSSSSVRMLEKNPQFNNHKTPISANYMNVKEND